MKKIILLFAFFCFAAGVSSQNIKGYVVVDSAHVKVVKLFGTHYERGFAYGYLCADEIMNVLNGYLLPAFGSYLPLARQILMQGQSLSVDSVYFEEAKGVYAGLDSAGKDVSGLQYIDIVISSSYLDILALGGMKDTSMGCSALMSWGNAVSGTDLDGKSVVSRHLDWSYNSALVNNQVIAVHIPSEPNEQPWLLIGFAGQIGVLSGVNQSGLGVFQNMLSDMTGTAQYSCAYEPVWFSLRKAMETRDYNGDGKNNVKDMMDVISENINGYADGYVISMLASANNDSSCLIAQVAETGPSSPYIVFRGNEFPDSISSDNLYSANYEIKRNDHYHFCQRYYRAINGVGNGLGIGSLKNWDIMRDSSNSGSGNLQFMQFIPDDHILKLAVYKNSKPAYQNPPDVYDLNMLFSNDLKVEKISNEESVITIFPNPATDLLNISIGKASKHPYSCNICDLGGRILMSRQFKTLSKTSETFTFNVSGLPSGTYLIRLCSAHESYQQLFSIEK